MVEDRDYGYAAILKGFEELGEKSISVGGIVDRRITPDQACQIVGARAKADIQKVYGSSELTENAESTIKHKKSDAPLIDTGRLRASVNYRVEG